MRLLIWFAAVQYVFLSVTLAQHVEHARDIFSPLESFVSTLLSPLTSADPDGTTTLAQSPVSTDAQTTSPTVVEPTPTSEVTVLTITATTSSEQTSPTDLASSAFSTTEEASSTSTPLTGSFTPTSNAITDKIGSTLTTLSTSRAKGGPTQSNPANPVQSVSSSPAVPSSPTTSKNNLSTAGVVVAIAFALIILALSTYLVIQHHPATNARYSAWRDQRRDKRTFRPGLDEDEEFGLVKAKAITLTPIILEKHRGIGVDLDPVATTHADHKETLAARPSTARSSEGASRPFSFQFGLPKFPLPSSARDIRRKPVARSAPRSTVFPVSPSTIGMAVPLGTAAERKALPELPGVERPKRVSAMQRLRRISGLYELFINQRD